MQKQEIKIERYDLSNDNSLRAWSAADEYLLKIFNDLAEKPKQLCIFNDRFGYLTCSLKAYNPSVILTNKSQQKAIEANLNANKMAAINFLNPLSSLEKKMDFALIKIPKSFALFQLFLEQIAQNSTNNITVVCAFMTRHFSAQLLEIASQYFEVVEQSKALKKARLLILNKKKKVDKKEITTSISYKNHSFQQYLGVFSANHIDYGTQFLLEHIFLQKTDKRVLDLGAGNGIIASEILRQNPTAEIHLLDDFFLAVASAKLNVNGKNVYHHFNNDLISFEAESFDLIVSNPPFHIEYEINIQIPIQLFKASFRCLKKGGSLQIVANQHLNYKVHLQNIFANVEILQENKKFVVYKCIK